jgi:hypothetical protein
LNSADWSTVGGAVRVRMAIHGGTVEARDDDFSGRP